MSATSERFQPLPPGLSPDREREFSVTFARGNVDEPVHRRFDAMAESFPEREAIVAGGVHWTYSRLADAARTVAWRIHELGGDRTRPVGLLMEAGPALFASMLGTLQAGRFYTPLDLSIGTGRARAIMTEADADTFVTDVPGSAFLGSLETTHAREIRFEEPRRGPGGPPPDIEVSPEDLAYLLFTSGSTGSPKGVLLTHRSLLHNVYKLTQGLSLTAQDRLTLLPSCSVGASVSDIYGALLNGAALCPKPIGHGALLDFASFVERERITIFHSVPSVFRRFVATLRGNEDLSSLRWIKLGGEPVLASDMDLYRDHLPASCRFHVGLGATEMNVIRQWFGGHATPCPWPVVPLGYPVDETEVVLLDEDGQPTDSDTGEIAILSSHLAAGYWRRPAETREAFRPVPGRQGWRVYRTGDLGRLLPDGCLLFLGRRDSRVKVRGHRVELLEVEAALARVPGVREAAVAARGEAGDTRLVAYFVPEKGRRMSASELRRALRERLSDAMIPSAFLPLEALPVTSGGKLDRPALPAPESVRPLLDTPYVEPAAGAEAQIARVFEELLRVDRVGAQDDFFDLGGDSLSVVEAIVRMDRLFERRVSPEDFLLEPTPAALAALVYGAEESAEGGMIPLRTGTSEQVLFLVPAGAAGGEELLVHARLARLLQTDSSVLAPRSNLGPHPPAEEIARDYVRRIRAVQPRGPYTLVGECVGGILAFEMARVLRSEGESISLLALLDTPYPTIRRRVIDRLRRLREPWGDDLVSRMRVHRDALKRIEAGRWRYFLSRMQSAGRAIASLRHPERRLRSRRRSTYLGSLLRWRPSPFDGTVSFVETAEGRRAGNALRWKSLAADIRVTRVPGDHHTYIREHVDSVASILNGWLQELGEAQCEKPSPRPDEYP
ncbi:MAG TPA: AMP-binding protein [Thermoanaerobaculia bacterium]